MNKKHDVIDIDTGLHYLEDISNSAASLLQTLDRNITVTELRALFNTPIEILPALTGQVYVIYNYVWLFTCGTTVYVEYDSLLNTAYRLYYGDAEGNDGQISNSSLSGLENASNKLIITDILQWQGWDDNTYAYEKGIFLLAEGVDLRTSAGNGSLKIHLVYEIVTI
jgi:hypothetical protein